MYTNSFYLRTVLRGWRNSLGAGLSTCKVLDSIPRVCEKKKGGEIVINLYAYQNFQKLFLEIAKSKIAHIYSVNTGYKSAMK